MINPVNAYPYYCFISHNSVVCQDYSRIKTMMDKLKYEYYYIFYGGEKHIENDHVVHIDCDDTYCVLPEKVNKIYKHINQNKQVNFIAKIDRTIIIKKVIDCNLHDIDYMGNLYRSSNGRYHFNRCEKTSRWYNKKCNIEPILYCSGVGYILSKKSINILADDNSYNNYVYEDYYVGSVLLKNNILPKHFPIKEYFYDPEHPELFL